MCNKARNLHGTGKRSLGLDFVYHLPLSENQAVNYQLSIIAIASVYLSVIHRCHYLCMWPCSVRYPLCLGTHARTYPCTHAASTFFLYCWIQTMSKSFMIWSRGDGSLRVSSQSLVTTPGWLFCCSWLSSRRNDAGHLDRHLSRPSFQELTSDLACICGGRTAESPRQHGGELAGYPSWRTGDKGPPPQRW